MCAGSGRHLHGLGRRPTVVQRGMSRNHRLRRRMLCRRYRATHLPLGNPLSPTPADENSSSFPQVYVISTRRHQAPISRTGFRRFPFALCLSYHFSSASSNTIHPSHLRPTNYSVKVVFRIFRDFHSVPVETQLCSSQNILYIQSQTAHVFQLEHSSDMFRLEHSPAYAPAPLLWNFTSTSLRSSSETWNMARGFRFMKLATNTSGIWPMRVW